MDNKPTRTARKKEETKQRIYQTAMVLFLAKGYDQTSVEEIVDKADVAKGTFFYHFPKKVAILSHLGEKRIAKMRRSLNAEATRQGSAQDKICAIFLSLGQQNEAEPDETKLVVFESFRRLNEIDEFNSVALMELGNHITKILVSGLEQGEIAPDTNLEQVARTLVGIYFITVLEWATNDGSFSLSENLLGKINMLFNGIKAGRVSG
ncbi:MAG: TetR/AcrR family transcriptional regulator [Thermincolia bacterium]